MSIHNRVHGLDVLRRSIKAGSYILFYLMYPVYSGIIIIQGHILCTINSFILITGNIGLLYIFRSVIGHLHSIIFKYYPRAYSSCV